MQVDSEADNTKKEEQRPKLYYTFLFAAHLALAISFFTYFFTSMKTAIVVFIVLFLILIPIGRTRVGQGIGEFIADNSHYFNV